MSVVSPFLNEQTFFITGATGLLGKVMLLKLLLEAPDARIYLLIRSKKGMTPKERFDKILLDSLIFEEYAINTPEFFDKITVMDGDVGETNLGLSSEDYNEVSSNATCILHLAATVNFDEPLKVAISLNVIGTMEVLSLARKCVNLRSVVHVSTAYVNSIRFNLDLIKEKVYPLDFDPYETIDYVMNADEEELERDCKKIIGDHPNTYTFSKAMAENIILEEKGKLPICMVRPSMISGSHTFPYNGWVDSFIGPAGLILAYAVGALHLMWAKKTLNTRFYPCRLCRKFHPCRSVSYCHIPT
jgi:fatty acyl-CoA reductase